MNSEELELSLRTEFENYLNGVLAGLRQEIAEFQKKIDSEFDKHKSQLDEAFHDFSARFDGDKVIDAAFKESVVEHLRLARDEGAEIAATAMAKAEAMGEHSPAGAAYGNIGEAVKDISSKTSQAAILESLVRHAERFTPRGAFFIVRNEHFVGWQVFGSQAKTGEEQAQDIHFPVSTETILADAVRSLDTAVGSSGKHADDSLFLDSLHFGNPERMYAVPLVARGRGVAVLYADSDGDGRVDIDALEALVRVASLTVELRASLQGTKPQTEAAATPVAAEQAPETSETQAEAIEEQPSYATHESEAADSDSGHEFVEPEFVTPVETSQTEESVQEEIPIAEEIYAVKSDEVVTVEDDEAYLIEAEPEAFVSPDAEAESLSEHTDVQTEAVSEEVSADFEFTSGEAVKRPEFEGTPVQDEAEVGARNGNGYRAAEPVVEVSQAQPLRSGLSNRNVNLPIEVADEERRFHNDARRFARLLVSEIKLYNEQKVREGLEANDLYDRLRDAIDRSREMYDKRVQPPVASKFDYFHYELVGALAEGDEKKLGRTYPGAQS